MRNKLMVTVAVAALIGCTSFAVAQEAGKAEPGKGAPQGQQHPAPGGAMQHSQAAPNGAPGGEMQHQAPAGAAQNQTAPSQEHSAQGKPQGEEHNNASTAQGSPNHEMNGKSSHENAQTQERNRTQENAQTEERNRTHENAQTEERNRTQENAQTQSRPGGTGASHENTAEGKGAGGGRNVQVSEQQRTKIKDIIVRDHNTPRVAHADFSVRVGVAVPRTVHVAVLPSEIVEIVPEYRGFDYIVVGDELLIIDPHSLEIVYILPA